MKRLLALLLCLALLLPASTLGTDGADGSGSGFETEELHFDEYGNPIFDYDDDEGDPDDDDEDEDGGDEDDDGDDSEDDVPDEYENINLDDFLDAEIYTAIDHDNLEINPNCPDHIVNILLLGVDYREYDKSKSQLLSKQLDLHSGSVKRADVVMILSVNLEDGSMKLTSLSRDLLLNVPKGSGNGTYEGAVNTSFAVIHRENGDFKYSEDRPERVIRTVNHNFQLNIQHYFAINFYGVEEIIEYFGGVDVELTKSEAKAINKYIRKHQKKMKASYDMHSEGRQALKEKNGVQHLDGLQGLTFARSRHVDNGNDLQRTGRTRRLLQSLAKPVMAQLKNDEVNILNLIPELSQYFACDMPGSEMVSLVLKLWSAVKGSRIMNRLDDVSSLFEEKRIPGDEKKGDTGWYYQDGKVKLRNIQATAEDLHGFIFGAYYPAD